MSRVADMLTGLMRHAGHAAAHLDAMRGRIAAMSDAELAAVMAELQGEEAGDESQLISAYCLGEAAMRFLNANFSSNDA